MTEDDIEWVEAQIGVSFDESRRQILRSNDSIDVQACPGSGKTTLLVAKLAILAEKWPHNRRGICVLSHTNVARREIEEKLGGTPVGQRLLGYPHFVGTIHGFVDEFLALPLLRSEGYHVRLIDNDACFNYVKRFALSWPNRKDLGNLPHKERTLDDGIWALVGAGEAIRPTTVSSINASQWAALVRAKREAVRKGLWFYEDMFAWAERLLDTRAEVAEFARWRFPAVFLDETQDTSELQGSLLNRVFPAPTCELRQRFGDSNQAIYDSGQAAATTDPFPADNQRPLPSSQRFGPSIATKVALLAPDPPVPALAGEGPISHRFPVVLDTAAMPHTIFLFAPNFEQQVLPAFGGLLLESFPDAVLRCEAFLARAIGRVGKPDVSGGKIPKHLGDYWKGYEPRVAKLDPMPDHLADYIHLAQRRNAATIDRAEAVKSVVKGIFELIGIVRPSAVPQGGQTAHWLWDALTSEKASVVALRQVLWDWCIVSAPIVEKTWVSQVVKLRSALCPIIGTEWNTDAESFCRWSTDAGQSSGQTNVYGGTPNRYRFHQNGRYVDVNVGTIHSAKGQTHTATLVLETFSWTHDLGDVTPWLLGTKFGAHGEGIRRLERLRLVYTAMTRPSHLLCLAMRVGTVDADSRIALESLGWNVKELVGNNGAS